MTTTYKIVETELIKAKRLPSSGYGNPRWQFETTDGTFRTLTNALCAYKGEPRRGSITLKLNARGSVIDYGWPSYPMEI